MAVNMRYVTNFNHPQIKRKLCLAIFNRATYSRCKSLIDEIALVEWLDLTVVLSSSLLMEEFGNAHNYISGDATTVNYYHLPVDLGGYTHNDSAQTAAQILAKFSDYLSRNPFDGVILVADRFEVLPAAIAASYNNVPIIHIQGGEITGNIDDKVRWAVSQLADYHFACTSLSKKYLIEHGEHPNRVYNTGCPSLDLIQALRIRRRTPKERYCISIFHPETTNTKEAYEQTKAVMSATMAYCSKEGVICHWYWPNPDPGREEVVKYLDEALKEFPFYLKKAINLEPALFLKSLAGARVVIGNSSCGLRECSFIGVPSINVGDRQRIRERAHNVVDVGYVPDDILSSVLFQDDALRYPPSYLYGNGLSARGIVRYLLRLDYTLKDHITYPLKVKFKAEHFGEGRFKHHRVSRKQGLKDQDQGGSHVTRHSIEVKNV